MPVSRAGIYTGGHGEQTTQDFSQAHQRRGRASGGGHDGADQGQPRSGGGMEPGCVYREGARRHAEGPRREIVDEPMKLVDGYLEIPDKPGLGIDLNIEACERYPFRSWHRPFPIRPDGSLSYQ